MSTKPDERAVLRQRIDDILDAVSRVYVIHRRHLTQAGVVCEHCDVPWPCPTADAFNSPGDTGAWSE